MHDFAGTAPLGHRLVGSGPLPVIVLNDWLCDTSTWDGAQAYLDGERFTWAFTDLRGYGKSRDRQGAYTLDEAMVDVLAVADANRWPRFAVVGHSMSTLVALQLGQRHGDRISHVVVVTPPPPFGFGLDDASLRASCALALADDDARLAFWQQRAGDRLSRGWIAYKVARWRATSEPLAVSAYVNMYARDGLSDRTTRVTAPVLAITGEQDMEVMRRDAVTRVLSPLCSDLTVVAIAESGHYPMQESPPLLVAYVEHFLAGGAARA